MSTRYEMGIEIEDASPDKSGIGDDLHAISDRLRSELGREPTVEDIYHALAERSAFRRLDNPNDPGTRRLMDDIDTPSPFVAGLVQLDKRVKANRAEGRNWSEPREDPERWDGQD